MFWGLKNLKQADDVRMANLLKDVDFLHHLLPRVNILHVAFIDGLDGNLSACKLVNSEGHLPECSLSNQLNKLIEVLYRWGNLSILLQV